MVTQRLRGLFGFLPVLFMDGVNMGRKTSTIPKAAVARILMKAGAKRVSAGGVDAFAEVLTDMALKISKKAVEISKHTGRKTVHESDIKLAAK